MLDDMLEESPEDNMSPWAFLHLIWMIPVGVIGAIGSAVALALIALLAIGVVATFVYIVMLALGLA